MPGLFKLPTVAAWVGGCGSGKTYSICNLLRQYVDHGSITHVFVISPTFHTNEAFDCLADVIKRDDVYTDITQVIPAFNDVLRKIGVLANAYKAENEYRDAYDAWIAARKPQDLGAMKPDHARMLERERFRKPVVTPPPYIAVVLDDLSHTDIYSPARSNSAINALLRFRHLHGIGASFFLATQTFKGGATRCLRDGCIRQFFVYRTKDQDVIESIAHEVASHVSKEEFARLYDAAVGQSDEHTFLTIDCDPPGDTWRERNMWRFRRNYDELLVLPEHAPLEDKDSDSEVEVDVGRDQSTVVAAAPGWVLDHINRPDTSVGVAIAPAQPAQATWGSFTNWRQHQAAALANERANAARIERELVRQARVRVARAGPGAIARVRSMEVRARSSRK